MKSSLEQPVAAPARHAAPAMVPRAFEAIVYGGLAVGVLDGLAAAASGALRGAPPLRVFQHVASGVLGRDAFAGGWATGALGVALHFVVAFGVATVFYLACRAAPGLLRRALAVGAAYGVIVFFAMRYVVVPLSLVNQRPATASGIALGVAIHIFFVGLPLALVARRAAAARAAVPAPNPHAEQP